MGRNGTELRGQHRNPVEHVFLGLHSRIPHTGYGYIPLESRVLLGRAASLELLESLDSFLLKIHLGESLLNILCGGHSIDFLRAFDNGLELGVCYIEKPCEGFLHDRIGKRIVELNVAPLVTVLTKDVCTEEAS